MGNPGRGDGEDKRCFPTAYGGRFRGSRISEGASGVSLAPSVEGLGPLSPTPCPRPRSPESQVPGCAGKLVSGKARAWACNHVHACNHALPRLSVHFGSSVEVRQPRIQKEKLKRVGRKNSAQSRPQRSPNSARVGYHTPAGLAARCTPADAAFQAGSFEKAWGEGVAGQRPQLRTPFLLSSGSEKLSSVPGVRGLKASGRPSFVPIV